MPFTARGGAALTQWLDKLNARGITVEIVGENAVVHVPSNVNISNPVRRNVERWANNYDFDTVTFVND